MVERSLKSEVEHLRLGAGETFTGEGILAIAKVLLESGVGYVGGYQGAPISHLTDMCLPMRRSCWRNSECVSRRMHRKRRPRQCWRHRCIIRFAAR